MSASILIIVRIRIRVRVRLGVRVITQKKKLDACSAEQGSANSRGVRTARHALSAAFQPQPRSVAVLCFVPTLSALVHRFYLAAYSFSRETFYQEVGGRSAAVRELLGMLTLHEAIRDEEGLDVI